ncbi:MAG TPA: TlpA disulfide reductase family protein [Dehalococcoidia bacterium]|nr:TlpA disulfide reductase family protein [Dehalococcoidia bacterium]
MHLRPILIMPLLIAVFLTSCSSPSSDICPPMGNIINIENSTNPLQVNDLIGVSMPAFSWNTVDCKTLEESAQSQSLNQYAGKPVIIVFHKTMNCPGCKHQLPFIQAACDKWENTGLMVLSIYRADKIKEVRGYIQVNGINFTALADPGDIVAATLGFAVGAPMTVFVDKQGVIQQYKIGPLQNQEEIENILKTL